MIDRLMNKFKKPPVDDAPESTVGDPHDRSFRLSTREQAGDDLAYNVDIDDSLRALENDLTIKDTYTIQLRHVIFNNQEGLSIQRILRGAVTAYYDAGVIEPYNKETDETILQGVYEGRYRAGYIVSEFDNMAPIHDAIEFDWADGALAVYIDDAAYDILPAHIGYVTESDILRAFDDDRRMITDIDLVFTEGHHKQVVFDSVDGVEGEFEVRPGRSMAIGVSLKITVEVIE